MKEANANLTSGRLLARNTVWNLVGQLLPIVSRTAAFWAKTAMATLTGLLLMYLATLPGNLATKAGVLVVGLVGFGLATWFMILAPEQRAFVFPAEPAARKR